MRKYLSPVVTIMAATVVALLSFTATAFAANQATGDEGSILELFRPVYDAFRAGHYIAAGALAVVFAVAIAKRYAPGKAGAFLQSDAGGALATLAISFAGAIAAATGSGQPWSMSIAWTAGGIAFAAAGGYAVIKKLVVGPLRASSWYQNRAPAWVKACLQVVFWVFDKPAASAEVVTKAEAAGDAAVKANPSKGAEGTTGPFEKF